MIRILRISFFGVLIGMLFYSCQQGKTYNFYKIGGSTMGTTYHISYKGNMNYKNKIDSLLLEINQQVSTYIDSSVISAFNVSEDGFDLNNLYEKRNGSDEMEQIDISNHFINNYKISDEIYALTNGYFDPTVMPLVNYWGFGYEKRKEVLDTSIVDSLKQMVGMHLISTTDYRHFKKLKTGVQLDFSAVAKGYAVDEIANLLQSEGCENYMVEIGGELSVKGSNNKGNSWVIGINKPKDAGTIGDVSMLIGITDCAVATSGNYRNFYLVDGQKYVHTINPKTGYTEQNKLLSATIIGQSCARVDAIATACMVMGVDSARALLAKNNDLEACLIYSIASNKDSIWTTDGFKKLIISK